MIKIYFTLLPVLVFTSCDSSIYYIGSSYIPTEKINVFVDEAAIPKTIQLLEKAM